MLNTVGGGVVLGLQVTNHVTRSGGGEVQPGLGASWGPVPRTRVLLERAEDAADGGHSSIRTATLIKSSRRVRPEGGGV